VYFCEAGAGFLNIIYKNYRLKICNVTQLELVMFAINLALGSFNYHANESQTY
jgi:hypothetical protein